MKKRERRERINERDRKWGSQRGRELVIIVISFNIKRTVTFLIIL